MITILILAVLAQSDFRTGEYRGATFEAQSSTSFSGQIVAHDDRDGSPQTIELNRSPTIRSDKLLIIDAPVVFAKSVTFRESPRDSVARTIMFGNEIETERAQAEAEKRKTEATTRALQAVQMLVTAIAIFVALFGFSKVMLNIDKIAAAWRRSEIKLDKLQMPTVLGQVWYFAAPFAGAVSGGALGSAAMRIVAVMAVSGVPASELQGTYFVAAIISALLGFFSVVLGRLK